MRNPNGYGSVYKLSGRRRKPWVARKTVGFAFNEDGTKKYPQYYFVGYYATKAEAMQALAEYNADPHEKTDITFAEVYKLWFESRQGKVSKAAIESNRRGFNYLQELHDMPIEDIRLDDMQHAIDINKKYRATNKEMVTVISGVFNYAVKHEIAPHVRVNAVKYIDLGEESPNKIKRNIFTSEQIEALWDESDANKDIPLILIYTGMRIGELLSLKKEDIDDEKISIKSAKTAAGVRVIPIHDRIKPLIGARINANDSKYLIPTVTGIKWEKSNFYKFMWYTIPVANEHMIHDTRHTFITMLAEAGVPEQVIKELAGHARSGVTEQVYTHRRFEYLQTEINKI